MAGPVVDICYLPNPLGATYDDEGIHFPGLMRIHWAWVTYTHYRSVVARIWQWYCAEFRVHVRSSKARFEVDHYDLMADVEIPDALPGQCMKSLLFREGNAICKSPFDSSGTALSPVPMECPMTTPLVTLAIDADC